MKPKPCTYCGGTDHTSIMCFDKPRKPLPQQGKTFKTMQQAYDHYYATHPPDENDLYYCYYCGKPLTREPSKLELGIERVTIDHYYSRSSHKHLEFDPKYFVTACFDCNGDKGSKSGTVYLLQKIRRDEASEKEISMGRSYCDLCGASSRNHRCPYRGQTENPE